VLTAVPCSHPYVKGDVVLPELASAYTDLAFERPGMILDGDVVTRSVRRLRLGVGWSMALQQGLHALLGHRPLTQSEPSQRPGPVATSPTS
jgi:hypothetical protein